jgi:hypothetical protein
MDTKLLTTSERCVIFKETEINTQGGRYLKINEPQSVYCDEGNKILNVLK